MTDNQLWKLLGDPIAQPFKGAYNPRWMHSLNWITSRSQSWKAWGMAFFVPNEFLRFARQETGVRGARFEQSFIKIVNGAFATVVVVN